MRPHALLCSLLLLPSAVAQQPFSQLSPAALTHAFVQHEKSAPNNQQDYITFNVHIISTDTFSNYRRFTTSVTLKSTADPDTP